MSENFGSGMFRYKPDDRWETFSLVALSALAISVSLGVAVMGIAKLLVMTAFLGRLSLDGVSGFRDWLKSVPLPVIFSAVALIWMALSASWSIADAAEIYASGSKHFRLLWLIVVVYLIRKVESARVVLACLMVGQLCVVMMSWLMWAGVPISIATKNYPPEYGILFSGHLEQPVMETLLAILLWSSRKHCKQIFGDARGAALVYTALALVIANVLFVMVGRTGYLVMFAFLAYLLWKAAVPKFRFLALLAPVVIFLATYGFSDRFHARVIDAKNDVLRYQKNDIETSQGFRLEMWLVGMRAAIDKPIIGYGLSSYPTVYREYRGREKNVANHPHQQLLFWQIEFGLIGSLLLVCLYGSMFRQAANLTIYASEALWGTLISLVIMSLANSPLYGAGIGEFFFVMIGSLFAFRKTLSKNKIRII